MAVVVYSVASVPPSCVRRGDWQGCPIGTRYFFFFFTMDGRRLMVAGFDGGWRLTDAGWLMANSSCSLAGALRRFEYTGGQRFFFYLKDSPGDWATVRD